MLVLVEFTQDIQWPIAISDTYGKAYIHYQVLEDDDEWSNFINELQLHREVYLKQGMK